ncbi:MAG: hypothetical protein QHH15_08005, partial [Candidatus Thermoplasmatota archaeon]|nr:hypothetical protein [Candidatus Thermoplasmatota archaeon]
MKKISKTKHFFRLVTTITSAILIFSTIGFTNGIQTNNIKDITKNSRDTTYLSIVPSNQTVNYGETFSIIVHLDPGVPVIGVQIDLSFNASLVHANSVANANPGVWNFFHPGSINNTEGEIHGACVAILGSTVTNPTDCFNITFTAQRTNGTSFLNLQNVIVINQSVQPVVTLIIINGEVTVNAPNNPPNPPSNPSPADGSTSVDINADLSWYCSDPDGNPLTYDIYFGTNSNPPLVQSNQSSTNYDPGTLSYDTTYYWMIVAWDNHEASNSSPIWHFTTITGDIEPPKVSIAQPQLGFIYIFFIVQWRLRIYPTN